MAGKVSLLIVDDEERFLKTLTTRLGMRDFDVTAATDGGRAVEAARERKFDLALVDLKMPGMDGEEVLELLKKNDPYIEVVILTGHGSIDSAIHCTKLGSYGYLQKPCSTDELLQVLKSAYEKRVRRKLEMSEENLTDFLRMATGGSPLSILRKLRELEEKHETEKGS